jgi:hypothetical protein
MIFAPPAKALKQEVIGFHGNSESPLQESHDFLLGAFDLALKFRTLAIP